MDVYRVSYIDKNDKVHYMDIKTFGEVLAEKKAKEQLPKDCYILSVRILKRGM